MTVFQPLVGHYYWESFFYIKGNVVYTTFSLDIF